MVGLKPVNYQIGLFTGRTTSDAAGLSLARAQSYSTFCGVNPGLRSSFVSRPLYPSSRHGDGDPNEPTKCLVSRLIYQPVQNHAPQFARPRGSRARRRAYMIYARRETLSRHLILLLFSHLYARPKEAKLNPTPARL
jgi:hypothetical protein